jgi:hypothetical protein
LILKSLAGQEARFYSLAPLGRERLAEEQEGWERLSAGVGKVMRYA